MSHDAMRLQAAQAWIQQLTYDAIEREAQYLAKIEALEGALASARTALAASERKDMDVSEVVHQERGITDRALLDGVGA